MGDGKFKPVSHVIMYDMKDEDQKQLVASVENLIRNLDAGDALEMVAMVQGNSVLKAKIIGEMTKFFQNQMNMAVL
jgi:alpha-galactosidase/6-phospho-beta-glucosidase family protein